MKQRQRVERKLIDQLNNQSPNQNKHLVFRYLTDQQEIQLWNETSGQLHDELWFKFLFKSDWLTPEEKLCK